MIIWTNNPHGKARERQNDAPYACYAFFPACSRFANVRRYAVETFMVLNVPVAGSKTFFFWILAFQVRRVERSEWLRVFPKDVFLPVLEHTRAMSSPKVGGESTLVK